eukprot:CAMPEP_0119010292 /NCGR_PEP_ID=MMETSP1176-20130426/4911_1 /TAXON_ID=265551 /ORGANISM="Synedropsis recta cf, Strain CCMP1620" /LENGTH=806 /DNA_ID=CAMNT_0006962927 /DNA_START=930 /DNA_END=3351 /DNA_ORIENTATION=+
MISNDFCFNTLSFLFHQNDEEIGALGSILSWDDEDDAVVSAAVAATASALEERDTLSALPSMRAYAGYPQQISIISGQTNSDPSLTTAQMPQFPYQMVMPNMQSFTMPQAPPQQQANPQQSAQAQQQQLQMTPAPGQNQQTYAPAPAQQIMQTQAPQQVANQAATQQLRGAQAQQPQVQQQSQQQQAYATMYQQQMYTNNRGEPVALQPTMVMQGQPQQAQDPNAFLRQMQLQYQQVPGAASRSGQPAAPMLMQPQQTAMATPSTVTVRRPAPKRKAVDVKPPAAPKSALVSCSDTDGETRSSAESVKRSKKLSAIAAAKKSRAEQELELANMTPAEKAKANRDRNREHARNTRLRKKAYLEKLKITVDELCRERDTLVTERAGAANLLVEMHNTRTEVLMSFFALRSGYEKQRELWSSILDESCFACVMPVTPYRSFPASEVQVSKCQRTVMGIDGMMSDTASLHLLLNTLVDRSRYPDASIQFRYTLVTEDAVVAGNQMMARWVMSTTNATQLGARMEVAKQGMLCCKFNSAHKIIGLELMFDVMAFMLQLKQAAGSHEFAVVPNTVQTCQRAFKLPMVMTLAERPYTIVQVNKLWEEMTGYKAEDVVGRESCRVLQGQETDRKGIEKLMSEVRFKRPAYAVIKNYTKPGKVFRNYMNVYPLSTDSKITHYVAFTDHAETINSSTVQTSSATQAMQAPPPAIGTPPHPNGGVVKPAQILHPQLIQQGTKAPTQQLMMQGNQAVLTVPGMTAMQGGSGQVVYYQAPRPVILPEATIPILQPIASSPTVIAPRNTLPPTVSSSLQK